MRADVDGGERLSRLAREEPRYGYRSLQVLIDWEGQRVNHKRLYRVYREAGLCRKRKKRKYFIRSGSPRVLLTAANQEWALDFAHDVVAAGRTIRVLSVMDAFTRECLALEAEIGAGCGCGRFSPVRFLQNKFTARANKKDEYGLGRRLWIERQCRVGC